MQQAPLLAPAAEVDGGVPPAVAKEFYGLNAAYSHVTSTLSLLLEDPELSEAQKAMLRLHLQQSSHMQHQLATWEEPPPGVLTLMPPADAEAGAAVDADIADADADTDADADAFAAAAAADGDAMETTAAAPIGVPVFGSCVAPCSAAAKWAAEEPAKGSRRWVTSRGFELLPPLRRSQTAPKVAVLRANSSVNLYTKSQSAQEVEAAAVARRTVMRGNTDTILNQSDERIDRLREGLRTMFREHVPPQPPARKPPSFWRGRGSGGATIGGATSALSLARAGKRVPPAAGAAPPAGTAEPMSLGHTAVGQMATSLRRISRP